MQISPIKLLYQCQTHRQYAYIFLKRMVDHETSPVRLHQSCVNKYPFISFPREMEGVAKGDSKLEPSEAGERGIICKYLTV